MIKERYCSYELSKLLKERGFDAGTNAYYYTTSEYTKSEMYKSPLHYNTNWNSDEHYYSAPTHQMACDWLRDKGYHIEIYTNASGYRFIISKTPPYGTDLVCDIKGNNDGGAWNDYGECIEDAIKYCLTELMKDESE